MTNETRKIKLLMVDDEIGFLNTLSKRLAKRDFDITTVTEGKPAIKITKKGLFDLAILDMKMPGMDGLELLKILKKKHKYLEVIILTGYGGVDSAVEAMKLGAYSYLEKPVDIEKLLKALGDAYKARLEKKFEHDRNRKAEIEMLSMGSSPMGILRSLIKIDDDAK
jgi:DNA-binding NtrC family response regulator